MSGPWVQHQIGLLVFTGVILAIALGNLLSLRRLGSYPLPALLPHLSVLVPARNEEAHIADCVRSLLAQEYPHFQVLVLDDHSTDGTGQILAALACEHERLRVLPGRSLPPGWLGKHWACHQLAQVAEGELLLFTDADTRHHPHALGHAAAALLAEKADLLTVLPKQEVVSWGERLVVPVLYWALMSFMPLALAKRLPAAALSAAVGQFMLFHRPAYERIGGHAAVRQDVVDDLALGREIKRRGLRWCPVDGGQHVRCRMYQGYRQVLDGFSKNLFAAFGNRALPFAFVWLWMTLVSWEPPIVLGMGLAGVPLPGFSVGLAAATVLATLAQWSISHGRFRFPLYLAVCYPVSVLLMTIIAARSMFGLGPGGPPGAAGC